MNRNWSELKLSPKEYSRLTGRSETDIRRCFLKSEERSDPKAMIRLKIPTEDILESADTVSMKESFEGCGWLKEIQRESRRNSAIKADRKVTDEELDIPEFVRTAAHLRRRTDKHTDARWIRMVSGYSRDEIVDSDACKEDIRNYMRKVRKKQTEVCSQHA